jgi:hypothetical protein
MRERCASFLGTSYEMALGASKNSMFVCFSVRPEPFASPFVLSLSKDEWRSKQT